MIIFDEIDAICKSRGSVRDGSGVHDTIVNQLLTKIDGVDALNNILLIGMTNRCALRGSGGLRLRACDRQLSPAFAVLKSNASSIPHVWPVGACHIVRPPPALPCRRRDMLDEALLRPGRLEVQVEIGLPDEAGRVQILQVKQGGCCPLGALGCFCTCC